METSMRSIKQLVIIAVTAAMLTACGSGGGGSASTSSLNSNDNVAQVAKLAGIPEQQVTDALVQQETFNKAAAAQNATDLFTNTSSATAIPVKTSSAKQVNLLASVTTTTSLPGTAAVTPPSLTTRPIDGMVTLTADIPVNIQFTTYTGTGPFTFSTSNMMDGLSLSSTGVLTGAPAGGQGVHVSNVDVKDSKGTVYKKTIIFFITVNEPFANTTLPDETVGVPVSIQLAPENNFSGPYTYSGLFPPGVTISKTGLISGTPTFAGVLSTLITTYDVHGNIGMKVGTVFVKPALVTQPINVTALVIKGVPVNMQLTVPFGTAPHTFSNIKMLDGLTMTPTGLISGSPASAAGMWSTFDITDANGVVYKNRYLLNRTSLNQPFDYYRFPTFKVGQSVSYQLYPSNTWTGPYKYLGIMVPGLTLSSTGLVSGTPYFPGTLTTIIITFDKNGDIMFKCGTATVLP